jgi:hypothetical protein
MEFWCSLKNNLTAKGSKSQNGFFGKSSKLLRMNEFLGI